MGEVQTMRDRPNEKLRGRDRGSLNLSTKLTAIEAGVIEDVHRGRAGRPANGAMLKAARGGSSDPLGLDIFAECGRQSDAADECRTNSHHTILSSPVSRGQFTLTFFSWCREGGSNPREVALSGF
jgi:hypothetical protein